MTLQHRLPLPLPLQPLLPVSSPRPGAIFHSSLSLWSSGLLHDRPLVDFFFFFHFEKSNDHPTKKCCLVFPSLLYLVFLHCTWLSVELCPLKDVEVLTPTTCEWDFYLEIGSVQMIKMKALVWTLIQYDHVLRKGRNLDRGTYAHKIPHEDRGWCSRSQGMPEIARMPNL